MVKYKKESVTKVEAAPASTKKPSKKSKRDAEVDLDILNNPKNQKKELIQAEKKAPPPKKVETSNSSDSKKELKKTQTNETPSTQARGGSNQLFAGNLSSKTKKSDLEKIFKGVGGEIKVVRLARGYAHVELASVEAVQKYLQIVSSRENTICSRDFVPNHSREVSMECYLLFRSSMTKEPTFIRVKITESFVLRNTKPGQFLGPRSFADPLPIGDQLRCQQVKPFSILILSIGNTTDFRLRSLLASQE
ncbi:hypothetical protein F2Q70_00023040 [Brassica cretica]|uniref:RRM domain-containing protein n=1 Tax=Brassica cretica TaxID=69181 RepID=A0A8S9GM91_BRACR|nr:hypothetical protein F2Q70_00023040 [Brassica cretica]